jgi:hypothetical protein
MSIGFNKKQIPFSFITIADFLHVFDSMETFYLNGIRYSFACVADKIIKMKI